MIEPDVAVVVITRDRAPSLRRTLAHLLALGEADRVVVVDNGSTDGTPADVRRRFPQVELIALDRNAGAAGRNIAAESLHHPFVAFADDDTRWARGALHRAAGHLRRNPALALVAGVYVLPGGRPDPLAVEMAASPLPARPGQPGPRVVGFPAGATMVRREAFVAIGGFDERFGVGGEEQLLALDLLDAGWDLCLARDVAVLHDPAPRSGGQRRARARLEARNRLRTALLRRPLGDLPAAFGAVWRTAGLRGAASMAGTVADLPWLLRERRVVSTAALTDVRAVERGSTSVPRW